MTDHLHPADEPTPEDLLASAFVDGDVTPDDAALVQASPELQARALSYLHLRADLADTGSAPDDQRELAISSALHEFDTLHGAAPVPLAAAASAAPVAPVVHLTPRTVWAKRVLAAAAAVAVLGVAGVVVFGSDDRATRDGTAARTAESQLSTEAQDVAGGAPPATIGSINGSADYALAIDTPQQLHDLQMPELAPSVAPTASDAGTAESAPAAKDTAIVGKCLTDTQVFLAQIIYRGTPAIAARDTVSGVTQAIDEQCTVLVEVAP